MVSTDVYCALGTVSTQATNSTEVAGRDHTLWGVLVQCSGAIPGIQCTLPMLNCVWLINIQLCGHYYNGTCMVAGMAWPHKYYRRNCAQYTHLACTESCSCRQPQTLKTLPWWNWRQLLRSISAINFSTANAVFDQIKTESKEEKLVMDVVTDCLQ